MMRLQHSVPQPKAAEAGPASGSRLGRAFSGRGWLFLGLALLIVPTLVETAREHWSREDGAHGPIILATALWLLWRERGWIGEHAQPAGSWLWAGPLLLLLPIHAFSAAYGILSVATASLYLILLVLAFGYWGSAVLRKLWFPLLYFAFLIVPPGSLVTEATLPLKLWISGAAVDLLYQLGYPVAQSGAAIYIAQYELLVETACAGLGSLLTLTALGLLYVHLPWASSFGRAFVLMAFVIPVAILANFIRVIALVLLTYHVGNEFAQGFAHDAAGMFMFVVAMLCMFGLDYLIQKVSGLRIGRS
jgi:exosortase